MKKALFSVIIIFACLLYSCTNHPEITGYEDTINEYDTRILNNSLSFQAILNDYTKKLQEAADILTEEYEKESSENQNGLIGLETIYNEKISRLSDICTEGFSEMAVFHFENGYSLYSEYEEWAATLEQVYIEESAKITAAYTKSANEGDL